MKQQKMRRKVRDFRPERHFVSVQSSWMYDINLCDMSNLGLVFTFHFGIFPLKCEQMQIVKCQQVFEGTYLLAVMSIQGSHEFQAL